MEDQLNGARINRYNILDCISKTDLIGMYLAFDTRLERNVLLKQVLHSADYSEQAIEYFLSESRSLAKLSHPNIAKVLDFGNEKGRLYLISEHFNGRPLSDLMDGPMPWQESVELLIPITQALAYAHSKGVIHRDLKPENIILIENDYPILSDFSLVRMIEEEETREMTGTNIGFGSPSYISPEQGKGLTVDFRSDIYSLGVIFFELITGQKPFSAKTNMEIVIQHVMTDPPKPSDIVPGLPSTIDDIILSSLSKEVDDRIQSMGEFSEKLKSVLLTTSTPEKKSPSVFSSRKFSALVIGLLLVSLAAFLLLDRSKVLPMAASEVISQTPVSPTPKPTSTKQAPTEKSTNTHIPSPAYEIKLPKLPVLSGTAIPGDGTLIDRKNVTDLVELAHWGNPAFVKYAFVGKDQMLISAASSGVYYLNPETLSPIYFFDAKGRLSTLAVSIDGEWVATGDVNGDVAIWNLHDGTEISRFETGGGPIRSIAFSSDRLKLAAASTDRSISVWELENRIQLYKLMKHSMNINKIQFSPDGDYVISSGDDFHVLMWDMKTGELANDYLAAQKVNDLDISADAVTLVLAMNDATIEIWDLITGKKVNTISDPKIVTPFSYVKFLPNNQLILTGSADGYVRIWNTQSRGKIWETPTEQKGRAPVQTISVSNDGSRFVVTFKDGLSEIWSINSQTKEFSTQFNHAEVARFAISPNDQLLAVQYGSSSVELWSIANARKNIVLEGALPRGNTFALSSDKVLIDSGGLILYSLSNSTLNLDDFPKNGYVNYSQDDKTVIAASGGLINYWSVATGLELKPSKISNEGNCWVISRLDGSFLAAGSVNGVMISNSNLSYFCSVSRNPRTISEDILSDGSIIAFALENKLIEVWDSRSETKFTLTSQVPGDILDVAISKDRELLVSVSEGGIIEIYDLPNRKLIHTLDLHTGPVNQVLFSNDGKYLISGAADGIFRIFGLQP